MKKNIFFIFALAIFGAFSANASVNNATVYRAHDYTCAQLKALVNQQGAVEIATGAFVAQDTYYPVANACSDMMTDNPYTYYQAH